MEEKEYLAAYTAISQKVWDAAINMLIVIAIIVSSGRWPSKVFLLCQGLSFAAFIYSCICSGRGTAYAIKDLHDKQEFSFPQEWQDQTMACYAGLVLFFLSFIF